MSLKVKHIYIYFEKGACFYVLFTYRFINLILQNNKIDMVCCITADTKQDKNEKYEGYLFLFMKNYYAPWLMKEWVRPIVVSLL